MHVFFFSPTVDISIASGYCHSKNEIGVYTLLAMETIRITPGFCPSCGSILPFLRANGNVKCYTCLTDWPPEGNFVVFLLDYFY